MSNHRAVLKPKDVKFKRINKAKARSLEELRDKLKWEEMLESVSAEEVVSIPISFDLTESSVSKSSPNRLALIRGLMERSASFDHDSMTESSVAWITFLHFSAHFFQSSTKGLCTLDIFAHNILIKKIKRHFDWKIFFLQNIVMTFQNIFKQGSIEQNCPIINIFNTHRKKI